MTSAPSSYLTQDLAQSGLKFGTDQLSQTASRASKMSFDPSKYDDARVPLPCDTLFQILQITDVTKSAAQELEFLNEFEDEQNIATDKLSKSRGKKRKVITNVDLDDPQEQASASVYTKAVHKMLLQDCFGNLNYAIELEKLKFIKASQDVILPIQLGSKIIIKKNTTILRGCFLLTNKDCIYIGGGLANLNHDYLKRRIAQLKTDIEKIEK